MLQDVITLSGAERLADVPAARMAAFLDAYAARGGRRRARPARRPPAARGCCSARCRSAAWDPAGTVPEARRHARLAAELAGRPAGVGMTADEQLREVAALVGHGADGRPQLGGAPLAGGGGARRRALRGLVPPGRRRSAPPSGPLRPVELDVVAALRAAHAGSDRFEAGWRARRVSTHGRAEAVRGERDARRRTAATTSSPPGRDCAREPGDELALLAREDTVENGFWMTFFGDWERGGEGGRHAAVLARLRRGGARARPRALRRCCSTRGRPRRSRPRSAPTASARADAVVTYLPPPTFTALVGRGSRRSRPTLRGGLRDPPPRLARRLARGVAAAEGRAGAESFGQSRCRLVAAALADAGAATPRGRAHPRAASRRAGLDPDRPHLEPGSRERYAW